MSPTVLNQDGYQVMIYLNDHTPAHVHVYKAENEARVQLDPVEIMDSEGFNTRELKAVRKLISENQEYLLEKWDEYHPAR